MGTFDPASSVDMPYELSSTDSILSCLYAAIISIYLIWHGYHTHHLAVTRRCPMFSHRTNLSWQGNRTGRLSRQPSLKWRCPSRVRFVYHRRGVCLPTKHRRRHTAATGNDVHHTIILSRLGCTLPFLAPAVSRSPAVSTLALPTTPESRAQAASSLMYSPS